MFRPIAAAAVLALVYGVAQAADPRGYLPAGSIDAARVIGPPPQAGSPAEAADIAAYQAGAAAVGTPRWVQAREDDNLEMRVVLRRYACAVNAELSPGSSPATVRLLERTMVDASVIAAAAKTAYHRQRPFAADDPATPLCIDVPPERRASPSFTYPSGHGTLGTVWGLVLTQAAPDRAGPIAERSRGFVESRQVCRVHYPSDLRAAERLGSSIFARLQSSLEFQTDLAAAKAEIAAASIPQDCPR